MYMIGIEIHPPVQNTHYDAKTEKHAHTWYFAAISSTTLPTATSTGSLCRMRSIQYDMAASAAIPSHIHLPQWPCTVDRAHRTEEANDTVTESDPAHTVTLITVHMTPMGHLHRSFQIICQQSNHISHVSRAKVRTIKEHY